MDHWVDRPEVQARQRAQPTGTNRPTRTTHPHAHPPAPAPERAGAGGEPDPASTTQPRTNPPTPQGGPATRAAHHNPTTVPAATAGGETPGPIPNPEAKPPSANGTAPTRERKSRTPPEHTPPARAGRAPQPRVHPTRAKPTPTPLQHNEAHGGALLCGPLALRWTTAVRPSFSSAKCASRRPGRGGAGRRGPRDRRVTAEHVT